VSLRELLDAVRVRWRRWRLLRAYSKVFEAKTGKGVGFTPTKKVKKILEHKDISLTDTPTA